MLGKRVLLTQGPLCGKRGTVTGSGKPGYYWIDVSVNMFPVRVHEDMFRLLEEEFGPLSPDDPRASRR
jgi:hypothetical protein